jgi:catechol 2,3-dioxygenase-like lactoylglutathione lyase family enzyme
MFNQGTVVATIAVSDIVAAQEFYEGVLGLVTEDENPGGVTYRSGSGKLFVYESEFAGTNQATYASWEVEDVDIAVTDLKTRGITFEHYDLPGMTHEGDVHLMGSYKSAWFKDPDGNILNVSDGKF